ncbi:chemokine XC receptor 1-like [Parambassis ranga]|uniref:Chemokine XC receptor 1-like n=1 Tax=Parambassis ranga TaxID=210632 RepID=A0A6P7K5L8_9TELE|nr:chemokine XC receptor 1-like [Parambassis ranga]
MTTTEYVTDYTTLLIDYYDIEYGDDLCQKTHVIEFGALFTPVLFSIVAILSLFGNILVLIVLIRYENLKSLTNTFILNLAISDLFFTLGLPFWAQYHVQGWTFGDTVCKTVNFIFYVGFYSSGILLIMMTAHRYIAVMNPLSDIVSTTGKYSIVASAIIWVLSLVAASPALIFTEVKESNYCTNKDSFWTVWGIYQQNALFLLSSVVFIFCYSQIICKLLRPTAQRRKNKTLKLIFILMVVFFVGWVPYNVVIFMQSFSYMPQPAAESKIVALNCESQKRLDYALNISRIFAFSHCCLNPVFYVFVGVKFKNHLKKMLKSFSHNNSHNVSIRNRNSRLTITSVTSGEELSL